MDGFDAVGTAVGFGAVDAAVGFDALDNTRSSVSGCS